MADLNTAEGRKAWTPTPEPENVGTTIPVYDAEGKAKGTIFVPINPRCPECEGHNGGHVVSRRRRR